MAAVFVSKDDVQREVVERDNGLCQDCGRASGPLHHIVPKSMLPGKLKYLRDQPRNLICLCVVCHAQASTKAARKRHLLLLARLHEYKYGEGQPWQAILNA